MTYLLDNWFKPLRRSFLAFCFAFCAKKGWIKLANYFDRLYWKYMNLEVPK